MHEYGIKRIVSVSSIGVGDSYKYAPWLMKLFIKISNLKIVFADHNQQEQSLINSNLDWTIVRPVALNNKETLGQLVVGCNKTPSPFKMSRNQLARFMIDNLDRLCCMNRFLSLSFSLRPLRVFLCVLCDTFGVAS